MEQLKNRWKILITGELGQDAIVKTNQSLSCQRCGNEEKQRFYRYFCEVCQDYCWYCRDCVTFGKVSTCTQIQLDQERFQLQIARYAWAGELSHAQQIASNRVCEWLVRRKNGMIHAVCGAGKTEMMFAGIFQALQRGQRICWSTPRSDVVKELVPRLQQAFPSTLIAAHYEHSPLGQIDAQLVVATTHQLIRYYQAFDCIIIDEVDAFPYTVDKKLQRFAKRAVAVGGHFIYLSATPSRELKKVFAKHGGEIEFLPARYHRRALPVPEVKLWGSSQQLLRNPWLRKKFWRQLTLLLEAERVVMVFVPTIAIGQQLLPSFQTIFGEAVAFVHSQDEQRQAKVSAFRERKLKILLTTTILERGVTINWCEVIVLDADHEVFDWSALVQISGRVDRKSTDEYASVWLIAASRTKAMTQARKEINLANKIARKRGLID